MTTKRKRNEAGLSDVEKLVAIAGARGPETEESATDGAPSIEPELPKLSDFDRQYWGPSELETAQAVVTAAIGACERAAVTPVFNFDPEVDFPEGFGLATLPITKRSELKGEGNIVVGMAIVAIPDPETIRASERGVRWMANTAIAAMLAKLANAIRPKADGTTAASIPFAVEDFISDASSLAAFNAVSGPFVKGLRARGLKMLTKPTLRMALQSAAFAEQNFAAVSQDKWEAVIDKMIAAATAKNLDPGILSVWRATRANVEVDEGDFDLSALDDIKV